MAGTMLGTAYVQIEPSAKGIKGSISNVLGGEAQAAGTSIGGKIGAFAKKAIIAAGIGTAAVKGIKAAMGEGAKLQQSYLGGLDTLYGDAAEAARAYAREAASAGISMNNYSEQAVSFGAALKNAFGGDVTKAAKAANTAILDMADNSAKMGTDITSVQMAYQGFAKQNYTMLDNLKLGYGGTKTEMERLLADAEKLSGQTYSIDNLGDVYEAIHVIQGDLGLTGVAAAEASETFSGSFAAMKASAANFMGSLALGKGVESSMSQLISSASTFFFKNFLPMLGTIAKSIPKALLTALKKGLPALVKGVISLIKNLTKSIEKFADGVTGSSVAQWASKNVPRILEAGAKLMLSLVKAIIINLPKIIAAIGKVALAILTGLGSTLWNKVKDLFVKGWNAVITVTTTFLTNVKTKITAGFNAVKTAISNAVNAIKTKISTTFTAIKTNITTIWTAIKTNISNIVTAIKTKISNTWTSIKTSVSNAVSSIKTKVSSTFSAVKANVSSVWNSIKTAITSPITSAKSTLSSIVSTIKSTVSGAFNGISSKVRAAFDAVKTAITSPLETAKSTVSGIISTIKGWFPLSIGKIFSGLKLPHFGLSWSSKDFGPLGTVSYPTGLSVSWYAKGGIVDGATILSGIGLGEAGPEAILPLNPFWKKMDEIANNVHGGNTINIYVNGSDKDPREIAEEVKRVLIRDVNSRRLAWQ